MHCLTYTVRESETSLKAISILKIFGKRYLFRVVILCVILSSRLCPIFQVSNVTGENLVLLKMFLNLLSTRMPNSDSEPSEFQIDDTYSVPVRTHLFTLSFIEGLKILK